MEDGVVMQLYWDCQELRTQLETATAPADREKLIQQSIQVLISNKLNFLYQLADRDLTISGPQCCEFGMFVPVTEFSHPGSNQEKRRG
jgi:hypothetical protein